MTVTRQRDYDDEEDDKMTATERLVDDDNDDKMTEK
jgi:hypothetical protein